MVIIADKASLRREIARITESSKSVSGANRASLDSCNRISTQADLLNAAITFAKSGLSVLPCEPAKKSPVGRLVPNGCKNATRDLDLIARWWKSGAWNIGIATGNVVVLDVDPRNGGEQSMQDLLTKYGSLPPTWVCNTGGGGTHLFFLPPPELSARCGTLAPGIDINGEGGYVIAAGSSHPNGGMYNWHPDRHPSMLPLATMPNWVADLCRKNSGSAARSAGAWADFIGNQVPEGERNQTVAQLAGYLFWRAVDRNVVLELAWSWNQNHCTPPLDAEEIWTIVHSIWRREQRQRGAFR